MKIIPTEILDVSSYAIIVFQHGSKLSNALSALDKQCGGILSATTNAQSSFKGEYGQTVESTAMIDNKAHRIIIVGTGDTITDVEARELGGMIYDSITKGGDVALSVGHMQNDTLTEAFAQGLRLKQYSFDHYKSKSNKNIITDITLSVQNPKQSEQRMQDFVCVADGVDFSRNLISEPSNVLYPQAFADRLSQLQSLGVEVEILGEKEMRDLGMNAILGVGQGSNYESKLVVMRYNGGDKNTAPLALVGKGVCFDTGGISIKPATGMEGMKYDMGGAGIVAGVIHAIASRKAKANVHAVVGLVENMPDGNAQRPGDVIKTMSGKTVEIINTDAEGRLLLADCITYAQKYSKPEYIIDLATLTWSIVIAIGNEMAGIFSNDDDFANALNRAGQATGEKVFRMPCGKEYNHHIASPIADMKNVGIGPTIGVVAGSVAAAKFIEQYVEKGVKWTHIDVAGMVWNKTGTNLSPDGATGYGVRLLNQYIADNFE